MSDMNSQSLDSIEVMPTVTDDKEVVPEENVPRDPESEAPETTGEIPETPAEPEAEEEAKSLSEAPLPGDEPTDAKKTLPRWAEKRLARKDAEIQQAAANAAAYKAELERIAALTAQQPQQVSVDPEAPKKDGFLNEGDYIAAMVAHTNKRQYQVAQLQAQQKSMQDAEVRFQGNIKKARDAGSEKYEDFEQKVLPMFSDGFPSNRAMAEAIGDSDYSEDMLYFLGSNLEKAEEIAKMNPIKAVKAIAEIEARFKARKGTQQTKAPAAIAPITSAQGKTPSVDNAVELIKNSEKMSQSEFEAAFKKIASQTQVAW